jgi:diguanylate cyclase
MDITLFYSYLRRQIPVLLFLSLLPGVAYVIFGYINDVFKPALIWYLINALLSIWGHLIYKRFDESTMSKKEKVNWYKEMTLFFYLIFFMWLVIFMLYVIHDKHNMHYIAIFTELGAAVVAATLLFPDKKLFIPILAFLMIPLSIYFIIVGT